MVFLDVDGSLCVGWKGQRGEGIMVDFCSRKSGSQETQAGFPLAGWGEESQPNTTLQNHQVPCAEWVIHYKQYMQMSALSRGAAHKWCTGSFQEHPFVKTPLKIISGAWEGCCVSNWGFSHWARVLLAPHPLRTEI